MTSGPRGADRDAPVVTLYRRKDCHLCEVALSMLLALQRTFPFRVEQVDIEGDPELERRYLLEIPVVAVGGEVVSSGTVNLDAIRAAVNNARIEAARQRATGEG